MKRRQREAEPLAEAGVPNWHDVAWTAGGDSDRGRPAVPGRLLDFAVGLVAAVALVWLLRRLRPPAPSRARLCLAAGRLRLPIGGLRRLVHALAAALLVRL